MEIIEQAYLEIIPLTGVLRYFPLNRDLILVGRAADRCDIVLDDPLVSRVHIQIERSPEGYWTIIDLGGANGTLLDGVPLISDVSQAWGFDQNVLVGETQLILRQGIPPKATDTKQMILPVRKTRETPVVQPDTRATQSSRVVSVQPGNSISPAPQAQLSQNNHRPRTLRKRLPGLTTQVMNVLLRPGHFFSELRPITETRQWVWIGLIILGLVGFAAVRQSSLSTSAGSSTSDTATISPTESSLPPGISVFGGGGGGGGGGDGSGTGAPPPDAGQSGSTDIPTIPISEIWTTALIAASTLMLGWLIQSILLCEVSLVNGKRPRLGRNFQIAIWAALPLALMSLLQVVYYWAGGAPGNAGLSGILLGSSRFAELPSLVQSLLLSLSSHLTLFWLWSLILLYIGARRALRGKWWMTLIVLVQWVLVLVIIPVATGAVKPPEPTADTSQLSQPGGEFPGTSPQFPSQTEEAPSGGKPGPGKPLPPATDSAPAHMGPRKG